MNIDEIEKEITDYLAGGGLFNPELANHDVVRDLLIKCRSALAMVRQLEADKAVIFDGYAVHKKLMEMRPSTMCKLGCLADVLDAIAAIWKESTLAN